MVLVMLSSTTCLWFGADDSLRSNYPREINLTMHLLNPENLADENLQPVEDRINEYITEKGGTVSNVMDTRSVSLFGVMENGVFQSDYSVRNSVSYNNVWSVDFVDADRWTQGSRGEAADLLTGLAEDEAVLLTE